MGTTWLWDRIRVSGGAYGGFSDFDSHSGMFTYLSYRDPNLLKTVDNYDGEHACVCELAGSGTPVLCRQLVTSGDNSFWSTKTGLWLVVTLLFQYLCAVVLSDCAFKGTPASISASQVLVIYSW